MTDIQSVQADDNPSLTEGERLRFDKDKEGNAPNLGVEQESQSEDTNWEKSSKYFQSEKDKLYVENKKIKSDMEKYNALGQFIESRKDVQEYLDNALQDVNPSSDEVQVSPPENFDPWEAYNDSNSESYKFRVKAEQLNVEKAVQQSTRKVEEKLALQQKMQEFDNELVQQGLDANDKKAFYEFANQPLNELGTDTLVKMWQAVDSRVNTPQNASGPREFDAVRRNQAEPTPVGVLQGEQPPKPNLDDQVWDRIVAASNRTKIV